MLLLTNDGELAHRLAHPRYEVEKVYVAEVEGEPSDEALAQLAEGVELDDGRTAPARVRRLHRSRVELVLHEGRKHQVKRMLEAVGHPVVWLRRTRYAGLGVEGLEPGEWRELTPAEVERLRAGRSPSARTSRSSVGAEAARAFSAPCGEQPAQLALVGAQLARSGAWIGSSSPTTASATSLLELAVAAAVVAGLDRLGDDSPVATDMISIRFETPGLLVVAAHLAARVGDGDS